MAGGSLKLAQIHVKKILKIKLAKLDSFCSSNSRAIPPYHHKMKSEIEIKMTKGDLALFLAAVEAGTYTLETSKGGRAAELAAFMAPGKSGAPLVLGFSDEKLASVVARAAFKAHVIGMSEETFAATIGKLGLVNSSAAKQAAADLTILAEGVKGKFSLAHLWVAMGGGRKASVEAMASQL